jgi:hypothetical protein
LVTFAAQEGDIDVAQRLLAQVNEKKDADGRRPSHRREKRKTNTVSGSKLLATESKRNVKTSSTSKKSNLARVVHNLKESKLDLRD